MTLTAGNGNGNEAILVLWRGGWADVDLLLGSHVLSRAPDLHDVAGCVALAVRLRLRCDAPTALL
jgi:hypothetical protein